MKMTLEQFEKAQKGLLKAKAHQETVKTWQDALKKIGNVGNQKVVAITIKDGKITTQCESDETADKPSLKTAKAG